MFWIGRGQGINGLANDLKDDVWRKRTYEVIVDSLKAPNKISWFSLENFAKTVLPAPPA